MWNVHTKAGNWTLVSKSKQQVLNTQVNRCMTQLYDRRYRGKQEAYHWAEVQAHWAALAFLSGSVLLPTVNKSFWDDLSLCCLFHNCTNILGKEWIGATSSPEDSVPVVHTTKGKTYLREDCLFPLPPGFWPGSGCRPQWPPERVRTWQAAWWETLPQTPTPGTQTQPHTRGPPSSLTAKEATTGQLWGHIIICGKDERH